MPTTLVLSEAVARGCEVEEGVGYQGETLPFEPPSLGEATHTIDSCCDACSHTTGCAFWNLDTRSGSCRLLAKAKNRRTAGPSILAGRVVGGSWHWSAGGSKGLSIKGYTDWHIPPDRRWAAKPIPGVLLLHPDTHFSHMSHPILPIFQN